MTIACDLDHLGKRYRARIKAALGILIGIITFARTDLVSHLAAAGILKDAREAERLFNPDDLMDVADMSVSSIMPMANVAVFPRHLLIAVL